MYCMSDVKVSLSNYLNEWFRKEAAVIDAFSSSQCKHHWNALISYLSFSIWPLNPIKVVSIASLLSHEALFISVLFKIPFCLVFLLHALFLSLYSSQTFGQKWSSFIFSILCFFLIFPPPSSQFHILSNSFTVTRVSFVLTPSYSLIFTLHTFVTPFLPLFFLQIFSFSLHSLSTAVPLIQFRSKNTIVLYR